MLKSLVIGILGILAAIGGLWLNQYVNRKPAEPSQAEVDAAKPIQVKTEMTGIPVVVQGLVTGYLVFQISSTVDTSRLPSPEFDVLPYILDATIRSSYQSTETGTQKFNAAYLKTLADLIMEESNKKLGANVVSAVNVEQFNFVPKEEIRGKASSGGHQ